MKDQEVRSELRIQAYLEQCRLEIISITDELSGGILSDLYALAAGVTNDLFLRWKIEDQIDGVFQAASDRAAAIRDREAESGDDVEAADPDDPAGSLGEAESRLLAQRRQAPPA